MRSPSVDDLQNPTVGSRGKEERATLESMLSVENPSISKRENPVASKGKEGSASRRRREGFEGVGVDRSGRGAWKGGEELEVGKGTGMVSELEGEEKRKSEVVARKCKVGVGREEDVCSKAEGRK